MKKIFKHLILCAILVLVGTGNAWAGNSHSTHYGKATVAKNGNGSVYLATSNSAASGETTVSWNCGANSGSDSKTYYAFAKPDAGWAFKGWSGDATGTDSPYTLTFSATSTTESSPTTKSLTATFVRVFHFKAKVGFVTGSEGKGDIDISFASGSPAYQSTAKEITKTQNGTDHNTASATETAYFYAQRRTGAEFRGWYSDAAGTNLVSNKESYSQTITSSVIAEPASPQLTLYAKFEKVAVEPTWALEGVAGTAKTLEIGETIKLVTETDGNSYSWGTPSYVDAGETNPVMTYDAATKTFTANRSGTVTIRFTQTAGEDAKGVLWKAGEQTFTFTVEKLTPEFAWADPLPHFTVGTTLPTSELFSFTPAEAEQNWTLTSSDPTNLPSIASGAAGLFMPKEVDGVTLTFHQAATWKWKEIENTSIKINVTKEPVVFNWKNPSLIAGNTYSWKDFVETNSEGAWNLMSDDESVIPTMRSIASTSVRVEAGTVTLSFTQGQDLGHDAVSIQTKTFTVYPSNGIATYKVNGATYTDLQSAINAASGSTKYNIIVASDGVVLPGDYTIPSGVTLVVPYESTGTKGLTKPTVLKQEPFGIQPFRTLKLTDGVNITVNGAISVTAEVQSGDAAKNPTGFPVRNVGVLDMGAGGHIDVESGGALYVWGFIKGQGYLDGNNTQNVGTITAKNKSTVKECYGIGDWGGGSYAYALVNSADKSYRIYPFQSYCVQNIEVPLRIEYGANDLLFTTVYGNSTNNDVSDIKFIGNQTGSLFLINSSNGAVTKWYDPTTDHMVVEMEGDAKLDNLQIKISVSIITVTIQAKNFDLPIPSNMHIKLKNCNLSLTSPLVLQPGAIFEIPEGSSLSLASNLFVYDKDEWGKFIQKKYFWPLPTIPTPKVSRGDGSVNTLDDAKLIVDGTFTIATGGALYTTKGGANIMGNGGGQLKWNIALPANGHVYGYTNGNGVTGSNTSSRLTGDYIVNNECAPARLHNDNDSYTASLSNGTFKNINGRWFKLADAVELTDHTYKFTYIDGDNTAATTFCVYTSDKTGLKAGYKWVNVALDNDFCGGKTFLGEDGNYYYYDGASKDAESKWVQLVKLNDALYSGSDNNLYTFSGCAWASVGEIGDDCMYTLDKDTPSERKAALVGTEFISLEKDEYDEVYVKTTDHNDYYMLFDGCVWQHATKIPDTYKAYEVLGNPYIWMGEEWVEVAAEGAYFYTTDDQGIKHFYEFDNVTFTWVPVRNKVRVTTPTGDRRDFLTFDDAISYLSQYNDPTVTLLEDVTATKPQTMTPGSKSTTCTIDLNGHKVMASSTLQYMWQVSSTVNISITDNSDKGNGELHVSGNYGGQFRGFWVVKGGVQMDGGKLFVENKNTAQTVAAIYLPAGTHAVVNGGEIEAVAVKGAFVIDEASTAATNSAGTSYVTITGGTMTGRATTSGYGVRCYCPITVSGGTINAITETMGTTAGAASAYGIYLNVSSSAVDANSYRASLTMSNGTINANSATSTAHAIYANAAVSAIANGKKSDGTSDNTYKSTDGSESNKAAAHVDITGGNLNATCGTSTSASGVTVVGCYNSYTDKSEANQKPHTIKNVKIRTSANGTAYGILVTTSGFADLTGGIAYGNAVIDNVDVYTETTGTTNAFGLYVNAAALWMNRAKYYNISAANRKLYYVEADANDGDLTHEAIAQTGTKCYKYHIGNHVQGAKAVVNGGTFYAKCATTGAYGLYVNTAASSGDNSRAYPEVTINGGTFTGESQTTSAYGIQNYGNTTVNAGTFNGIAATTDAYGVSCIAGTLTLNGGTINATTNGTNAFGIGVSGTVDTSYGVHEHGTVEVNDGVVVNAQSLASGTAYGIYAVGSAQELTPAKYDASTLDKTQIFCINEDGTIYKNATANTTNDSQKKNLLAYRCGTFLEEGVVNVHGGTFNVNAYTSTAAGVATSLSNVVRTTEIGHFGTAYGTVNVYKGTFNVSTETGSTALGVRNFGKSNIYGGTFNITAKTTNAEGVRGYFGTATVEGGTFNINAMTNTAYGVYATGDWDANYAFAYPGNIIVNGGTFNVKTYGGDSSYGVNVGGVTKNMKAAKVSTDVAKDYAVAGMVTINGGEFTMTPSTGKSAYGVVVAAPTVLNAAKAYSRATINGGFFKMVGLAANSFATGVNATEDGDGDPQLQVKGGHFSTKANLEQASPKNYVRDPYKVISCIHPEYKKDYPFEVAEVCTITFNDNEGNLLWSGLQPKGTMAIYPLNNGVPEKTSPTSSYDFTGWDTPLETITGDATYVANFDAVAKRFMVTWKDEAGNEIDHKEWASGQTPTHDDPVKEGYTFTGWTPSITAVVDADQNYKATFSINSYTIIWLDEDGSEIKRETKQYGSTLTAPKPTKEGYTFKVWTPGVEKVTGDQTYQASYLLNVAEVTDASTGKTTPYTTWSSALTAANKLTAGGTLKVLDDVKGLGAQTFTQTFTLDLNGHTLASATTKFITMGTAGKTLTIDDSKGGGRIEMIGNSAAQMYAVYISNGAVTLAGGTIYGENVYATANDSYRGEGVYVEAAGKFNMTGGTVEAVSKNMAFAVYAMGPVNITGGTLNATARTKARGIYVAGAGTNTLTNLQANATTTVAESAIAVFVGNSNNPTVNISGGKFTAVSKTTAAYALDVNVKSTVTVDGTELYAEATGAAYGIKTDVTTATTTASNLKVKATTAPTDATATAAGLKINSGYFDKAYNLSTYTGTKKVVALNPSLNAVELAEGYNYKIVDAAYQVTFKAEDGAVLQQANIEAGVQPAFLGEAQTKPSTPKYAYDFDGWMDASDSHVYTEAELPIASKDVVYTAHFAQRAVEYPITFSNIDGLGTDYVQMVAYGEEINYDGPTPYMSGAVSNYAYTFIGWSPELAVVDGPASYSPRYDLVISHNVSFVINNVSATTPTMLVVAEGAAVERPADQLVDCQHIVGWYKDAVLNEEWNFASDKLGEEDLILYAKWETKTYTITWLDEFGDEIDQTVVNCGVVPTHANLYKPSTAAYSYEWKGWNKTLVAANADATYKSLGFNQVAKRYEIIFNTNGGSAIAPIQQEVGSDITAPADPTREGYTFAGWDREIPTTMPAEDVTITASWTINQYTITFNSNGGSTVASITQDYNTSVTAPADPTRDGYSFAGWSEAVPSTMPAENKILTASWTINKYSITFQNEDGTELQKSDVEYGVVPSYTGATPAKTATAEYTYTFKGWDVTPVAVTGVATYTATYTETKNKYSITFKNEDGSELQKSDVEYGIVPSYTGATPTKAATAEYTYTFKGWDVTPVAVTGAATYTATFTATKNKYTIIFKNEDGTELQKSDVEYGILPSYTGATPTKAATAEYTYTFKGWDVTPVAVTGEATYTATYSSTTNKYTITWKDENDVVLGTDEVDYGVMPSHTDLTKAETDEYTYTFNGWSPALASVTGPATYKSLGFTATPKSYTLTWNLNGGDITTPGTAAGSVAFGTSLTAPTVEKTGYTFDGWNPAVTTMPAHDQEFTAQWRANQYTITFNTDGGTSIDAITADFGAPITRPADPTKDGYSFAGWDKEIPSTMPIDGMTITASWTKNSQEVTEIEAGDGDHSTSSKPVEIEVQTTAETVTIKEDGEIVIDEGATLTVTSDFVLTADAALAEDFDDEFDMPAQAGTSGQITFPEGYSASQEAAALTTSANVYFDLNIDIKARTWYAVSVPWQVDANDGIAFKDGKTLELGTDEDITYYDGKARADYGPVTAKTVVYLEDLSKDKQVLQPGTMYFLYFAKNWPNATIRFTKKTGTSTVYTGDVNVVENAPSTGNDGDGGWNGISNPKIYSAYVNAGVEFGYVFVGGEYVRITLAETKFAVGTPVMVQVEKDTAVVINRTPSNPATAPARARALDPIKIDVFISGEDGRATDRLTIKAIEDEKEDKYVIGQDLAKMSVSTKKAQLWVDRYKNELTVNTQTLKDNVATYPLVLSVPSEGDYTIDIRETTDENVYLTYNGKVIWNLSSSPYTLPLAKGKSTGYGLRVVAGREIVTSIDEAAANARGEARKVMVDGILYILRGDKVFDANGKEL